VNLNFSMVGKIFPNIFNYFQLHWARGYCTLNGTSSSSDRSYYCVTDSVQELKDVLSCEVPCPKRVQCLIKLVLTVGNFCEFGLSAVSCNKKTFIILHGNEYLILLGNSDTETEVKPESDVSEEPKEISADHLCRVCACKSDDLVPVFGEKGVGMQLLDKIHTHLPIMVNHKLMTDNTSKYFCLRQIIL
jgi:hypothetical protein